MPGLQDRNAEEGGAQRHDPVEMQRTGMRELLNHYIFMGGHMAYLKSSRRHQRRLISSISGMVLRTVHQGCSSCRRSTVTVNPDQVALGEVSIKGSKHARIIVHWDCPCGKTGKKRFSPGLLSRHELAALVASGNGAAKGVKAPRSNEQLQ